MATRWFGPRPVVGSLDSTTRHGSCGCCKCGGFYSAASSFGLDGLFGKYASYRDGLRMKLIIADVPDGWNAEIFLIHTDVTGLSGVNGTRYFDIQRTQYGCIWSADDFDEVAVEYHCYETDENLYDYTFEQITRIGGIMPTPRGNFFARIDASIQHSSADYIAQAPSPIYQDHPFIGLRFVPDDSQYGASSFGGGAVLEDWRVGWDATRLPNVITGSLRFFLCNILGGDQYPIDLTNANWTGIDTFWDTATDAFKTAGTFTAEIERL